MAIHETIAENHRTRVYEAVKAATDGLTDFEIASQLGMFLSSVNATRNHLMNLGLVVERGDKRPSGRGGMAKVWVSA